MNRFGQQPGKGGVPEPKINAFKQGFECINCQNSDQNGNEFAFMQTMTKSFNIKKQYKRLFSEEVKNVKEQEVIKFTEEEIKRWEIT